MCWGSASKDGLSVVRSRPHFGMICRFGARWRIDPASGVEAQRALRLGLCPDGACERGRNHARVEFLRIGWLIWDLGQLGQYTIWPNPCQSWPRSGPKRSKAPPIWAQWAEGCPISATFARIRANMGRNWAEFGPTRSNSGESRSTSSQCWSISGLIRPRQNWRNLNARIGCRRVINTQSMLRGVLFELFGSIFGASVKRPAQQTCVSGYLSSSAPPPPPPSLEVMLDRTIEIQMLQSCARAYQHNTCARTLKHRLTLQPVPNLPKYRPLAPKGGLVDIQPTLGRHVVVSTSRVLLSQGVNSAFSRH